jgi:polyphosphate kinase 2 (PPK2 family)
MGHLSRLRAIDATLRVALRSFGARWWEDRAPMGRLDEVDLNLRLSREEEEQRLEELGRRLALLRLTAAGLLGSRRLGPPLLVLMEGWDASGKGGTIKRLVAPLDIRHVRVASFGAPTPDEKRHHFLQRFADKLPGWGGMAVFDRTWYGRVLVERVEGFATETEWRRAYGEIVDFERMQAAEGMVLVKVWLHISADEQLKRFEKRRADPLKAWKLTDEDWRNRAKRPAYEVAVEEMLERTSTEDAPWSVVPAESKGYARVEVMRLTVQAYEDGLRRFDVPVAEIG